MSQLLDSAIKYYNSKYNLQPVAAGIAPGRAEILGNHTDYNGGVVLAAALDRSTVVVGDRLPDGKIELYAPDVAGEAQFNVNSLTPDGKHIWANYVCGVVVELNKLGFSIGGFRAAIHSNVPGGSGLSSSAAIELATATFLRELYPYELDKMPLAQLCQRVENHYVGVNSGLLDQFSSAFGVKDSLLFLDCKSLDHSVVKIAHPGVTLVICNSMVKHALTSGHYNERRAECEQASGYFGKSLLRDVDEAVFEREKHNLPENVRHRAEHIFGENRRVFQGVQAAQSGDIKALGEALTASHRSSRDLFQNSIPELDFLVDTAIALDGCYGARLTGGGWGGATVNLVDSAHVEAFTKTVAAKYQQKTGVDPNIFVCNIGDGAHSVQL